MWVSTALAAGFSIGEPGACATSRPCVAGGDSLADSAVNPAAATSVTGYAAGASLGVATSFGSFTQEGSSTATRASLAPTPLPRAIVAARHHRWVFAAHAGPPVDGARRIWPTSGVQRYALVRRSLAVVDVGGLVATQIGPVSAAIGAAGSWLSVDQSLVATTAGGADPTNDIGVRVQGSAWAPSAQLGVRVDVGHAKVGAVLRSGAHYLARGPLTVDFSQHRYYTGTADTNPILAAPTATDGDTATPLTLPPSAAIGVEGAIGDVRLEVAATWEGWHVVQDLTVEDVELVLSTVGGEPIRVTDAVRVPMPLRDTVALGVGGDWRRGAVRWRAGVRAESGAAPASHRSALVDDGPKMGVGLGVRVDRPAGWTLETAIAGELSVVSDLSRSVAAQVAIDPLTGRVGYGDLIGRGRLQSGAVRWVVTAQWASERR
jgi:hypothetical protein